MIINLEKMLMMKMIKMMMMAMISNLYFPRYCDCALAAMLDDFTSI